MDKEALEKKVKELTEQMEGMKNPPKKFTESLEIPEDATPADLKKILAGLEDHLQKEVENRVKKALEQVEEKEKNSKTNSEKAKFDAAVKAFKEKNPKLFTDENKKYLQMMDGFLGEQMEKGLDPEKALEESYKELLKVSKYEGEGKEEKKEEKKEEEKEENEYDLSATDLLSGNFNTPTKVDEKNIQTKGSKNEREAARSAFAEMQAEGLSFPTDD